MDACLPGIAARVQLAILPLLLSLLTGCWYSEKPLIDANNASVIPFAGKYVDPEKAGAPMEIAAGPDRSYDLIATDSTLRAYFLKLGEDWYVYQMKLQKDREPGQGEEQPPMFLYNLMKQSDGNLYIYSPKCDEETAKIRGIEDDAHDGCRINTVKALKKAARRLSGEIDRNPGSGEPDVLRPWVEE